MAAEPYRRSVCASCIAAHDGAHDGVVLLVGTLQPAFDLELSATERADAPPQSQRKLGDRGVVRPGVDRRMKCDVGV